MRPPHRDPPGIVGEKDGQLAGEHLAEMAQGRLEQAVDVPRRGQLTAHRVQRRDPALPLPR